jgi:hypothetical protein
MMFGIYQAPPYEYTFTALPFIPYDVNDNGWVVGSEEDSSEEPRSAMLYHDGKTVNLAVYGACARVINNRNHILITNLSPSARAFEPSLPDISAKDRFGFAFLEADNRTATYLGVFNKLPVRLLDTDEFLTTKGNYAYRVKIQLGRNTKEIGFRPFRKGRIITRAISKKLPFHVNASDVIFADWNQTGRIVGWDIFGSSSWPIAFVTDPSGHYQEIGHWTMDSWPRATLVNSRGDVVVSTRYSSAYGGGQMFEIWNDVSTERITSLESPYVLAEITSLNDAGQVVGFGSHPMTIEEVDRQYKLERSDPNFYFIADRALLWKGGKLRDLNDLAKIPAGAQLWKAAKINNKGWVVGSYLLGQKLFGFLLTPLPH